MSSAKTTSAIPVGLHSKNSTPAIPAAPETVPQPPSHPPATFPGAHDDSFRAAATAGPGGGEALSGVGPKERASTGTELATQSSDMTVSLPSVLGKLSQGGSRQALIGSLSAALKEHTGVDVASEVRKAVSASPERILDILAVTPAQMRLGFDVLQGAAQARAGARGSSEAPGYVLPQHTDLGSVEALEIARPAADLRQIAPGLFRGTVPSDLPDAQAKLNIIMSEVLNRLASNASAPSELRFSADFNGKTFHSVEPFLRELVSVGYVLEASVEHLAADVFQLKAGDPEAGLRDVATPIMVRTGARNEHGDEAVLPASHSELVLRIRSGTSTPGPELDSAVKWYQGTHATGFFPYNVNRDPEWRGRIRSAHWTGDDALQAAYFAGLLSDVINHVAQTKGMKLAGYGATGVCNDSVAIVQKALGGEVVSYPLLMKDSVVMGGLQERLAESAAAEAESYGRLADAVQAVPSDAESDSTSLRRALASIPWPVGSEVFPSTSRARVILESALARGDESTWY